jgi:ethanolaminephosphotransferase
LTTSQFCKEAQDVMSSTASNYDISRLVIGTGLAAASLMLAAVAAWKQLAVRNVDGLIFVVITALYGIMMFASSYVEEEQHFWYWLASGWFAYLRARRYVCSAPPLNFGF